MLEAHSSSGSRWSPVLLCPQARAECWSPTLLRAVAALLFSNVPRLVLNVAVPLSCVQSLRSCSLMSPRLVLNVGVPLSCVQNSSQQFGAALKVRNIVIFKPSYYALSELRNGDLPNPGATRSAIATRLPLAFIFRALGATRSS